MISKSHKVVNEKIPQSFTLSLANPPPQPRTFNHHATSLFNLKYSHHHNAKHALTIPTIHIPHPRHTPLTDRPTINTQDAAPSSPQHHHQARLNAPHDSSTPHDTPHYTRTHHGAPSPRGADTGRDGVSV